MIRLSIHVEIIPYSVGLWHFLPLDIFIFVISTETGWISGWTLGFSSDSGKCWLLIHATIVRQCTDVFFACATRRYEGKAGREYTGTENFYDF